jgi:hypothetical protein
MNRRVLEVSNILVDCRAARRFDLCLAWCSVIEIFTPDTITIARCGYPDGEESPIGDIAWFRTRTWTMLALEEQSVGKGRKMSTVIHLPTFMLTMAALILCGTTRVRGTILCSSFSPSR